MKRFTIYYNNTDSLNYQAIFFQHHHPYALNSPKTTWRVNRAFWWVFQAKIPHTIVLRIHIGQQMIFFFALKKIPMDERARAIQEISIKRVVGSGRLNHQTPHVDCWMITFLTWHQMSPPEEHPCFQQEYRQLYGSESRPSSSEPQWPHVGDTEESTWPE